MDRDFHFFRYFQKEKIPCWNRAKLVGVSLKSKLWLECTVNEFDYHLRNVVLMKIRVENVHHISALLSTTMKTGMFNFLYLTIGMWECELCYHLRSFDLLFTDIFTKFNWLLRNKIFSIDCTQLLIYEYQVSERYRISL